MKFNYFTSFALMALLCLSGSGFSQNIITYGDIDNITRVDAEFFGRSLNKSKKTTSVGLEIAWAKPFEVPSNDFVTLTSANPFHNEVVVNITSQASQVATFYMFDVSGKLVFSGNTELTEGNNTLSLDQRNFPISTGTYILNIQDESGRNSTIKLVKR
jgi:hypothetical protein